MSVKSRKGGRWFSSREARALLWLLPVLAVASWLVWMVARPPKTPSDPPHPDTLNYALPAWQTDDTPELDNASPSTRDDNPAPKLFAFDPNTVSYHDLVRLGFSRGEALGIVKYRERGKVFEIPEDFAACYQVSEAMYRRLEPCIAIGEKFRLKPFARPVRNIVNTSASSSNSVSGNPRAVSPDPGISPIELNTADSAALISVKGIGEKTVVAIIEYRARLGGFVRAEQLAEVRGVTQQNYERIVPQIFIDTLAITKIDINFDPAKRLAEHPYIRAEALRKLLKHRQLKGGWSTTGELRNDNIFTPEELNRLAPYLVFN